jgi:hypothetical protein
MYQSQVDLMLNPLALGMIESPIEMNQFTGSLSSLFKEPETGFFEKTRFQDPMIQLGFKDLIGRVVGGVGNLIGSINWNNIVDGAANLITSVDWNNVAGFVTNVVGSINPLSVVSVVGNVTDAVSDIVGFFLPQNELINLISTVGRETVNLINVKDIKLDVLGRDFANLGLSLLNLQFDRSNLYLNIINLATSGAAAALFDDAGFAGDIFDLSTRLDARKSGGWRFLDGDDYVKGSLLGDIVNGNQGLDYLVGLSGSDFLRGGRDNDRLDGGDDDDILNGNIGNDEVRGGAGNDFCRGGQGDDLIDGGAGDDILIGDRDFDMLIGGSGADFFVLQMQNASDDAGRADRIADFNAAEDRLKIVGCDRIEDLGLGSVDVNSDGQVDTAILCAGQVLGVVMGTNPTVVRNYIDLISSEEQIFNIVG